MTQTPPLQTENDMAPHDRVMSLWDHLDELRSRLFKSVLALCVVFCAAFTFSTQILLFLKQPLVAALPPGVNALHFTGPMDVFMAGMKLSFLCSIVGAAPVWIFQLWRFVEPALYPKERRLVMPFAFASIALFFLGLGFCYLVMIPMALSFFLEIGMQVGTPLITISDYLSMLIVLLLGFGLIFETPVILLLLSVLGLIQSETLIKNRRMIIVVIFIIAAVLTPPDVISQVVMAAPMYVLFELSVVLMRFTEKKRQTDEPSK